VIECSPAARFETDKVAAPSIVRAAVPNTPDPSLKLTPPVGVPNPGGLTFTLALKVIASPNDAETAGEVIPILVEARSTTMDAFELMPGP
jgi:hypothetical protein